MPEENKVGEEQNEEEKEPIFGVLYKDVQALRNLDPDTIDRYRQKIECKRLKEKCFNCFRLVVNFAIVVFLLFMMSWLTAPKVELGREIVVNCSNPKTFGYKMQPYTFIINDESRKDENKETKRKDYNVYPCQQLRFIGEYTFNFADQAKSGILRCCAADDSNPTCLRLQLMP